MIEFDIRQHIQLFSDDALVAEQLTKKYENQSLSLPELDRLGLYFLNSGQGASFVSFCLRRRALDLEISWAFFTACLFASCPEIPKEIKQALHEGARESSREDDICRAKDLQYPEYEARRRARRQEFNRAHQERRFDLLARVEMLRSQEMEEEEEQALLELGRLFPGDEDIRQQQNALRERKAIRILENKLQGYEPPWENQEPALTEAERQLVQNIFEAMRREWQSENQDEHMGHDFAVALMQWEAPLEALDFLSSQSSSLRILWTRLEALLQARHFVELLNELERGERLSAHDPEATFALLYLKAHALWGLGHRFAAVEILEGIANHRPHYRSVVTLLHLWKGGSS